MASEPTVILSHWNTMIENLAASPQSFYQSLEEAIDTRQVPNAKCARALQREGGILSAKREYLTLRRGDHVFHICGAPFGNGFFVSWWLGEIRRGFLALLSQMPVVGIVIQRFVKPLTYYQIDTALMFQSLTHSAVLEVVDALTKEKGLRGLTELERKPILRDFLAGPRAA
jgi:hypothetical protein